MGTDINSIAQKRNTHGEWETLDWGGFEGRNYRLFAFLADVKGIDANGFGPARGLPDDLTPEDNEINGHWLGEYGYSWIGMDELLAVDYTGGFQPWDYDNTCNTLAKELGDGFFHELYRLKLLGAERIVFGFDS